MEKNQSVEEELSQSYISSSSHGSYEFGDNAKKLVEEIQAELEKKQELSPMQDKSCEISMSYSVTNQTRNNTLSQRSRIPLIPKTSPASKSLLENIDKSPSPEKARSGLEGFEEEVLRVCEGSQAVFGQWEEGCEGLLQQQERDAKAT